MISVIDRLFYASFRAAYYLLYHQFAWSYDLVAWIVSLGNWDKWVKSALPYLTGPCILEIGYGPGHLQAALREKEVFATGVDASPQMASMTRSRLEKMALKPGIILGYAQNLPFENEYFDQVVATFPSEYIIQPQTLQEIHRVLAGGGVLIIVPFAWLTSDRWYARVMAMFLRAVHESPDWEIKFLQPFEQAGFHTKLIPVQFETSKLLIIIAEKSDEPRQSAAVPSPIILV